MKVATEVWIVTALLHREYPQRADFEVREIVERAAEEKICAPLRSGFNPHVNQQCVANRPPNPARLRMLFETARGRRRLYRHGDPYDHKREGGKIVPDRSEIPERYRSLLEWYEVEYAPRGRIPQQADPILALHGRGKEIRGDEHPDDYVRRLREEWR